MEIFVSVCINISLLKMIFGAGEMEWPLNARLTTKNVKDDF